MVGLLFNHTDFFEIVRLQSSNGDVLRAYLRHIIGEPLRDLHVFFLWRNDYLCPPGMLFFNFLHRQQSKFAKLAGPAQFVLQNKSLKWESKYGF